MDRQHKLSSEHPALPHDTSEDTVNQNATKTGEKGDVRVSKRSTPVALQVDWQDGTKTGPGDPGVPVDSAGQEGRDRDVQKERETLPYASVDMVSFEERGLRQAARQKRRQLWSDKGVYQPHTSPK